MEASLYLRFSTRVRGEGPFPDKDNKKKGWTWQKKGANKRTLRAFLSELGSVSALTIKTQLVHLELLHHLAAVTLFVHGNLVEPGTSNPLLDPGQEFL